MRPPEEAMAFILIEGFRGFARHAFGHLDA